MVVLKKLTKNNQSHFTKPIQAVQKLYM